MIRGWAWRERVRIGAEFDLDVMDEDRYTIVEQVKSDKDVSRLWDGVNSKTNIFDSSLKISIQHQSQHNALKPTTRFFIFIGTIKPKDF